MCSWSGNWTGSGRSLSHLVGVLTDLQACKVAFRSLTENIETQSAAGRLVAHMMAALAEFELALIAERTREGIKAAKSRGVKLGRRPSLNAQQVKIARKLREEGERAHYVARALKVSRATVYNTLKYHV